MSDQLTRRAILADTAAVTTAVAGITSSLPAIAAQVDMGDDAIVTPASRRGELAKLIQAAADDDDQADLLHDERMGIELEMLATPAQSLAGVLAKARLLAEYQNPCLENGDLDGTKLPTIAQAYQLGRLDEWAFSYSIWADLERLAGGAS